MSPLVQFTPPLLGQHHQEPPVCVRHDQDSKSGRLLVGHRSGFHGFFFSQRDPAGEGNVTPDVGVRLPKTEVLKCGPSPARTHQQASLRQRHSHVQAGSEGFLQAGQGPAANHGLRVQGLPAAGVEGRVRFSATFKGKEGAGDQQVMTGVCRFRNTKTNSTRRWRSESSTSSSANTSQRSAKGFGGQNTAF